MGKINDAQIELENLARDVETSAAAFAHPDVLREGLRSMESYLNKLISEYEKQRPGFPHIEPASRALSELPGLRAFLESGASGEFRKNFVQPFHRIQAQIREDLLHPMLVSLKSSGSKVEMTVGKDPPSAVVQLFRQKFCKRAINRALASSAMN